MHEVSSQRLSVQFLESSKIAGGFVIATMTTVHFKDNIPASWASPSMVSAVKDILTAESVVYLVVMGALWLQSRSCRGTIAHMRGLERERQAEWNKIKGAMDQTVEHHVVN